MCHKLATYDLDSFWAGINGYLASSRIPFTVIITTVEFCELGKSLTKKIKRAMILTFHISLHKKKLKTFIRDMVRKLETCKYSDVRGVICNLFFLQSKSLPQEL